MREALAAARRGTGHTRPNPPVGAVLVAAGKAAAKGYHRRAGTAHAEIVALNRAGAATRGATLYVTLEPCCTLGRTGPCTDAIVRAGVKRVVVATRDPNPRHSGRGIRILRKAGLLVDVGLCRDEARVLLAPFSKWVTTGVPYVTLKMAMSLDGRIADATGRSRWITGPEARRLVHAWRAEADAVLVGRGTACADDPSLLSSLSGGRDTYRVVVDSRGSLPAGARMLNDGAADRTIIATTSACPAAQRKRYEALGAAVLELPLTRPGVSLRRLFRRLGTLGLLHVLCEGGGRLAHELVRGGMVDEYAFFVAPCIVGSEQATGAVHGDGWRLPGLPALEFTDLQRLGRDVLLRAVPQKTGARHGGR